MREMLTTFFVCFRRNFLVLGREFIGGIKMKSKTSVGVET